MKMPTSWSEFVTEIRKVLKDASKESLLEVKSFWENMLSLGGFGIFAAVEEMEMQLIISEINRKLKEFE